MTPLELALASLSEATAITLHRDRNSQRFPALERDATDAGATAGEARKVVEKRVGRSVVSSENYLHLKGVRGREKKSGRGLPWKSSAAQKPAQQGESPDRQDQGQLLLFDEPGEQGK